MATRKPPMSALFLAARDGRLEEVKCLLDLPGVDINESTEEIGFTPLHAACVKGHTDMVMLLLNKGANPNRTDKNGVAPLHLACLKKSQSDIVRLLLECRAIDVNIQIKKDLRDLRLDLDLLRYDYLRYDYLRLLDYLLLPGFTPLHVACYTNSFDLVQQLLFAPGIDLNIKDAVGRTPVMLARDYDVLALLNKYVKSCDDFPVHTVTKVVLCGNTGAGKSTLAQIILDWPSLMHPNKFLKAHEDPLRKVKPLTAGILSYYVPRSDGSIMLYDLAGHLEYYSSHSSCLEALSRSTPSTFLTLADISAKLEDVKTQLSYWSALIGNVCSKCPQPSEVIVIGTHVDEVKDKAELSTRCSLLQHHADEAVKKAKQHFAGFIGLNVRDYQSADMKTFIRQLLETNVVVRKRCPAISLKCHVLYALLKEKVPSDRVAMTLSDLLQLLDTVEDHGLNTSISEITSCLTTLSDKGLITFFLNTNPSDSWIVLRSDVLLEKVNGILFAPASHKEYRHCLVSNTGIIPTSKLQKIFPEYDIKMIVQFLFHCELCQPVIDTTDTLKTLTDCVFFPCLVDTTQPSDAIIRPSSFVWQMYTSSGSEFFTPRCLHALMRRLANQFTLPSEEFKHDKEIHCFSRRCEVWTRGIAWRDKSAIHFIVEMDESFQCLSFAVLAEKNNEDLHYPKQHKCVLAVLKKCCEDFCPSVAKNMKERIRCPSLPCLGSSMAEVELPLLIEAISSQSPTLVDASGKKSVDLDEWFLVEPQLPLLIGVSMNAGGSGGTPFGGTKSDSGEIKGLSGGEGESASGGGGGGGCRKKDDLFTHVSGDQLGEDDLADVIDEVMVVAAKWRSLGLALRLKAAELETISSKNHTDPTECIRDMLLAWLQQCYDTDRFGLPSWRTLCQALSKPSGGNNPALARKIADNHLSMDFNTYT